jgi:hypothetical protein
MAHVGMQRAALTKKAQRAQHQSPQSSENSAGSIRSLQACAQLRQQPASMKKSQCEERGNVSSAPRSTLR